MPPFAATPLPGVLDLRLLRHDEIRRLLKDDPGLMGQRVRELIAPRGFEGQAGQAGARRRDRSTPRAIIGP